jgi:DUF218 domain
MRRQVLIVTAIAIALLTAPAAIDAWGVRAHTWINRVAVQAISADGPVFLKAHEEWIGYLSTIPDTWRRPSEPFLKMLEDPNHGWFKEQFAFMQEIPRSRYEFVLKLYDEQRRLAAAGDPAAALTNVRWTGTMAYAAVEGYERMLSGMRRYRDARARNEDTRFVEQEIAFYMGWTGHYTGDGAQPLHDTVHHDGWQGANPRGFTTNPQVHGLFETRFVDLMKLEGADLLPKVPPSKVLADPFTAIVAHLDEAGTYTEKVYELEQKGALADGTNPEARALVIQQAARGATLLRDLAHTAWINSGRPPENDPAGNPITPAHPRYNPATGSAPAHVPGAEVSTKPVARQWQPHTLSDPVVGKNFFLLHAIKGNPAITKAIASNPALVAMRDARLARLATAAASCKAEPKCHADAFRWSEGEIQDAEKMLREALMADKEASAALVGDLLASGFYQRYATHEKSRLIADAWRDAATAMNRIIDVYALGVPPLYKAIDSMSYDPSSDSYRRMIDLITSVIHEQRPELIMFYEPTLSFTRRLLDANRRDEAARFEPLHLGENARAFRRIPTANWSGFKYSAILVPGAGPDRPDVSLDPWAKMRIELAVARFRNGDAPFIIVSGGNVHPSQTPFNEAFEMKKSLIRDFDVPPDAILIDPHARHTTTNLRNAARLALRYGMPSNRPMLITSDASQSAYISGTVFRDRCLKELGYLPGVIGNRLSKFDLEFTPGVESLHADARDPLDP